MIARMPTAQAPHHAGIRSRHWRERQPDDRSETAKRRQFHCRTARDRPKSCRRCPLWRNATETVFGEGLREPRSSSSASSPATRRISPASLSSGRPARSSTRYWMRPKSIGSRSTSPTRSSISSSSRAASAASMPSPMPARCRPAAGGWTGSSRSSKPDLVVALGATAAQSLLGKPMRRLEDARRRQWSARTG